MQRVCGRRANDNGRPMLVIMKDRYVHPFPAELFDNKAVRRFDIFKVNRAKGGFERTDDIGKFFRVCFVDLDVKAID